MEPLSIIGSIIGAGGSIFGSVLGADAQDRAQKSNNLVNMMNFMLRQQERQDRIREAERARDMAFEGTTDAAGTRTRYVPGKGWVVDLSADGQENQDLQDRVQRNNAIDQGTKRDLMYRNIERQLGEGQVADGLLRELQDAHVDPEALRREMLTMAMRGSNQEWDGLQSAAMRQAIRTGSSNIGDIIKDIGKQRAKDQSDIYANIPGKARMMATQIESQQKSGLANLYNMFAQRASNVPGFSFQPQNIQGAANGLLNNNMSAGQHGEDNLIAAFGQKGGTLDYSEPNMGWANAASVAGQSIGNIFSKAGADNQKQAAYDSFMKRFSKDSGTF